MNINKVSHQSKKHDRQQKHCPRSQQRHMSNQPTARKQSKFRIDYANLGIDGLCLRCGRDNHLVKDCKTDKSNLQCTGCSKTGHVIKVHSDITWEELQTQQITFQENRYQINTVYIL